LNDKEGDDLELQYRHTLEALAREPGLLGTIFRKAPNKIQATGRRVQRPSAFAHSRMTS
jgi:hypothetical protein